MSIAVAKQYAQALHEALEPLDGERAKDVIGELTAFRTLLAESPELRSILLNPSVNTPQKKSVIGRLAESLELSQIRNFLMVVIERRRIGLFPQIQEAYEELVSAAAGITRAQIIGAAELTAEQRDRIETALKLMTGGAVLCKYDADESLLGGAVVQIGSTVYDGSIRGQIETLRQRLTE
jgi:F-type H+-transporting ATPase subunit delta